MTIFSHRLIQVLILALAGVACKTVPTPESEPASAFDSREPLFRCVALPGQTAPITGMEIFWDQPDPTESEVSEGRRLYLDMNVRAILSEQHGMQGSCAAWRSSSGLLRWRCRFPGGGLMMTWPGEEPGERDAVEVRRSRFFGFMGDADYRLHCQREFDLPPPPPPPL